MAEQEPSVIDRNKIPFLLHNVGHPTPATAAGNMDSLSRITWAEWERLRTALCPNPHHDGSEPCFMRAGELAGAQALTLIIGPRSAMLLHTERENSVSPLAELHDADGVVHEPRLVILCPDIYLGGLFEPL